MKIFAAFLITLCFSAQSNAQQVDTSGNLINDGSWSGIVYGADPGGCCASISGAGPLYDTTTDTIMFSYGQTTIGQTIGINQALGGTGIQVQGYNYSWDFRYISNNGNENDSLTFNVALRSSSGAILESQSYNYDGLFSLPYFQYDTWITASATHTYNNPYLDPQSISLSITGRDGGFWAGYYGPEVRNVSLSVNYSFDPCAADPLYSSSCPGYFEAWMANLFAMLGWSSTPEPEIEIASVNYSLTPSTSLAPEETTTGEVKIDAGGIELSTTGELSVPDGIPEEAREKKSVDMNLIRSIVREATDDSKTLSIVNQSIEQSMDENANPDFSMTNETLASIDRQRESSIQQSILENLEVNQSSVSNSTASQNAQNEQSLSSELQNENKVETSELQNQSLPRLTNEDNKETTQTVKKNVQDNETAGDVTIDSLAQTNIDFNDYLNQQMKDMAFYAPKEIYKGQKNVDNARAQRQLSGASDRLHQQMVDEQYR